MAKTNFSKVEEILARGLNKITVNKLLVLADVAASVGNTESAQTAREKVSKSKLQHKRLHWISSIKRDLHLLYKRDKKVYKKLHLKKDDINDLIKNPHDIKESDWEFIEKLYQQLGDYKKEFVRQEETESDEDIIESERLKHINKRFNINEKWLPLK